MRLEKEKVLCIQHAWRRVVARERARCLRKLKLDEYTEATIKIQNTYRKWRAMKKLYLLRERKRSIQRRICATRIQVHCVLILPPLSYNKLVYRRLNGDATYLGECIII